MLPGFLGPTAPILFAVALIAAGQSSTITGTIAGQIIMEGYLKLRLNPWLRRLVTRAIAIIPALLVILIFGEEKVNDLLILSQVILSLQLGFAIIPLIHFVSDKEKMGNFTIKPLAKFGGWIIATILVYLNMRMLGGEFIDNYPAWSVFTKVTMALLAAGFVLLLAYVVIYPILVKRKQLHSINMHAAAPEKLILAQPVYKKIAVALEFSKSDSKLISFALAQGEASSQYLLIHVVESASTTLHGKDASDFETNQDQLQMDEYVKTLRDSGFEVEGRLGFNRRVKEISRIVSAENCDLLVMGAHGHTVLKDFLYGETINSVRHKVKIPVLIVNL